MITILIMIIMIIATILITIRIIMTLMIIKHLVANGLMGLMGPDDFDNDEIDWKVDQKAPGGDKSLQPTLFLHSFDCNLMVGGWW